MATNEIVHLEFGVDEYSSISNTTTSLYSLNTWTDSCTASKWNKYNIWMEEDTCGSTIATSYNYVDWHKWTTATSTNKMLKTWVRCHVSNGYLITTQDLDLKTPQEKLREVMQARHAPMILTSRKSLIEPEDVREIRARETLRRILGDQKFQRFLKDGFISVHAKSGKVYQIFPAHNFTKVYFQGKQVESLCVVLKGNFPPTDSLIMRYLIILNDEERFRGYAKKHSFTEKRAKELITDERTLTEIFKEMKSIKKVA